MGCHNCGHLCPVLIADGPGSVANNAEFRKMGKYASISNSHFFVPIGIETSGTFGQSAKLFFQELGNRLKAETEDSWSSFFLLQRIAVAVQRGNTAAVLVQKKTISSSYIYPTFYR